MRPSRESGDRDEDIISTGASRGASIVRTKEKFENKQRVDIYVVKRHTAK